MQGGNRMRFAFDFARMETLLRSFGEISSVRCSLTDNTGRIYCASREISPFCARIKSNEVGRNRCKQCNAEVIQRAGRAGAGCTVCRCHAGLLKAVVPVRQEQETLAFLLLGQVIGEGDRDRLWRQVRAQLGFLEQPDELYADFCALSSVSGAELEAAAHILEACASSVWMAGMLKNAAMSDSMVLHLYISEHYAEPLSLPGIARALSMSKTKLCSLAAAEDTTVLAMINGKRVEEAARLLRQRGCTVAEAAEQVGVHDHNYFTKIFKAYMGETPRDYQKRAQRERVAQR